MFKCIFCSAILHTKEEAINHRRAIHRHETHCGSCGSWLSGSSFIKQGLCGKCVGTANELCATCYGPLRADGKCPEYLGRRKSAVGFAFGGETVVIACVYGMLYAPMIEVLSFIGGLVGLGMLALGISELRDLDKGPEDIHGAPWSMV